MAEAHSVEQLAAFLQWRWRKDFSNGSGSHLIRAACMGNLRTIKLGLFVIHTIADRVISLLQYVPGTLNNGVHISGYGGVLFPSALAKPTQIIDPITS